MNTQQLYFDKQTDAGNDSRIGLTDVEKKQLVVSVLESEDLLPIISKNLSIQELGRFSLVNKKIFAFTKTLLIEKRLDEIKKRLNEEGCRKLFLLYQEKIITEAQGWELAKRPLDIGEFPTRCQLSSFFKRVLFDNGSYSFTKSSSRVEVPRNQRLFTIRNLNDEQKALIRRITQDYLNGDFKCLLGEDPLKIAQQKYRF